MSNEARKSEAVGEKATIQWREHTFEVERDFDDWTLALVEALEEGRSVAIIREALGPAQWSVVKAEAPRIRDITGLADDIAHALGFGSAGESAPSSD
jgi:hypothetical protein